MKYLKSYKIYEDKFQKQEEEVQPIIDTINDILIELTDNNDWDIIKGHFSERSNSFKVDVKNIGPLKNKNDRLGILVSINKSDGFIRTQSEEVVNRINDYLGSFLSQEGYRNRGYNFDGYTLTITYRWKGINESINRDSLIDLINDICLELSDKGFHGRDIDDVRVQNVDSTSRKLSHGVIFIQKYKFETYSFKFSEISESIYRLKDAIGIDNMENINYELFTTPGVFPSWGYKKFSKDDISNETIDPNLELKGMFITFKYTKINETVWTSGIVTGSRKVWSDIILNKIQELNLISDNAFTGFRWGEAKTRPYEMSYEMSRDRISLTLSSDVPIPLDDFMFDNINHLSDYLRSINIGVMNLVVDIRMIQNSFTSHNLLYDTFTMDNMYDLLDRNSINIESVRGISHLSFTFKNFDKDISEYTEDYVDRYNDMFLPPRQRKFTYPV